MPRPKHLNLVAPSVTGSLAKELEARHSGMRKHVRKRYPNEDVTEAAKRLGIEGKAWGHGPYIIWWTEE